MTMNRNRNRFGLALKAALLLAGALAALAQPAAVQAQVQYRPTPSNLPPTQTQAVAQPTVVAPPPAPYYNPYPAYPTIQGPTAGYLNGVANITNAQGQYAIQTNQARMINQQVEQEKIRTRQMLRDQERYEQSLQPSTEDIREQQAAMALRRARRDPPNTDIWSATSLNVLLKAAGDIHKATGARGPVVPLNPSVMSHINLSGGTSRGPSTVLRSSKLKWPLVLQEDIYTAERQAIDRLLPQAAAEAREGNIQLTTVKALTAALDGLKAKIDGAAQNLSLQEIVQAQRFAEQISDAISLVKDPNAANYFNGTWDASKASTVAELVDYMTKNGLSFAPAAEADRTAYLALYQAMSAYDMGISRLARR
jgi:hypothetical protein